jgi:hypothetical protein
MLCVDAYKCTMFWRRIGLSKSPFNSNSSSMEVEDLPSRAMPKGYSRLPNVRKVQDHQRGLKASHIKQQP